MRPQNVMREDGSVVLIAAASVVLCGVLALGIGKLGGAAALRAQARTAADAAALAGAAEGKVAAADLAAANGARLTGYADIGDDVVVKVNLDGVDAIARARREWDPPRR